jgi:hypothetical protein
MGLDGRVEPGQGALGHAVNAAEAVVGERAVAVRAEKLCAVPGSGPPEPVPPLMCCCPQPFRERVNQPSDNGLAVISGSGSGPRRPAAWPSLRASYANPMPG